MGKTPPQPHFDFKVTHEEVSFKHLVTFSPVEENEGFPPKTIELTQEQWDALRFHFGIGQEHKSEHLCYFK